MVTPLVKVERKFQRCNHLKSLVQVQNYNVDENGDTILSPVPEHQRKFSFDGKSLEIANMMFGSFPDTLSQVQMFDQMEEAEYITSHVVRRFGELKHQKEELEKQYINNENV